MGTLLKSETFDTFLLREGLVRTYMDFSFDGTIRTDYFDSEELTGVKKYAEWGRIREYIFSLIRGKKTPLLIKLGFVMEDGKAREIMGSRGVAVNDTEQILLSLNIIYSDNEAKAVTGVFRSAFTMGHEMEYAWDEWITDYFKTCGIVLQK